MSPIWFWDQSLLTPVLESSLKQSLVYGAGYTMEIIQGKTDLKEVKSQFQFIGSVSWVTERYSFVSSFHLDWCHQKGFWKPLKTKL